MTSDADTQPGSDSLFPTGFSGGGALVRQGSVGTGEIADGSVAAADLNLPSVAAAIAARSELTGTYAQRVATTVPPTGNGLWMSSSLRDMRVSPSPGDRTALLSTAGWGGAMAEEPQVFYLNGTWHMYYSGSGSKIGYASCTGDPTIPANWTQAAAAAIGQGAGGESGKAYHSGVYVEGSTIYLTYTDDTHINYATASTSTPGTLTKQGVLLNLTDTAGTSSLFGNSQISKDGTTYYLDYDCNADNWQTGYATATTVTGPYTNVLTQGKMQSMWPGQPVAGGNYNGSPVAQGGNCRVIKENGVWVNFYHVGPKVSGSLPTDGYRATSTDRQVWTVDNSGAVPFIARAASTEVEQVADLCPVQGPNGTWYCFWTAYTDNANSKASVMVAPMSPVLKQYDGVSGWQPVLGPGYSQNASIIVPQRRKVAYLTTDVAVTSVWASFTPVQTLTFTPRGTRATVAVKCVSSMGTAGQYAYFRASSTGGTPVASTALMGCLNQPVSGYQVSFAGDMTFSGLTPGVTYTFGVEVAVNAGTWNCRPSSLARQEQFAVSVEDALWP